MSGSMLPTVTVEGVNFHAVTEQDAVSHIMNSLASGRGGTVVTPNVDILRQMRAGINRDIAAACDLVLADGMPVVWASRLKRSPLPERVTGASLAWELAAAAERAGLSVFVLGGAADVPGRAAAQLVRSLPGRVVAGHHSPPMDFTTSHADYQEVEDAVVLSKPDIVLVGLGFPKQELLSLQLRTAWPGAWYVGCGAAVDFMAGDVPRAPAVLQRLGLEWTYRLVKEPRRLARRYLQHGLPYAAAMLVRSAVAGLASAHVQRR